MPQRIRSLHTCVFLVLNSPDETRYDKRGFLMATLNVHERDALVHIYFERTPI